MWNWDPGMNSIDLSWISAKPRSSETSLIVSFIKGNVEHTEVASDAANLTKLRLMLRK